MDRDELIRRLAECEGRKSPYMQKEPPERLPGPESAPSQYMQKMPPPERLPGPDSDPFELGPDPYAGKDLYDLPPDVAREIERRRGIKSRFANPGPPSINGSYAQPKASPAPSGYGSKRKYVPPVSIYERGVPNGDRTPEYYGDDDYFYRGISEQEARRNRIQQMDDEIERRYGKFRRGYGY